MHPIDVNSNLTYIAGARLVYIFNSNYALGIGSYNMVSRNIKAAFIDEIAKTRPTLEYNYFGGDFEYFFNPENYYCVSAKSKFSVAHVRYNLISTERQSVDSYFPDYGDDWFYFVEPSVNLTLNMTRWLKTSFGVGYRIAFGGDYRYGDFIYGNKELSGISGNFFLTIGNF